MDDRQKAGPDAASIDDAEPRRRFYLDLTDARATAVQTRLGLEAVRGRLLDPDLNSDVRTLELRLIDLQQQLIALASQWLKLTGSNEQGAAPMESSAAATTQIH